MAGKKTSRFPKKPLKTGHGTLAKIFREFLVKLGYADKLMGLVTRYKVLVRCNAKELKATDNIMKEMTSDSMTFNTLLKLLKLVGDELEVKFTLRKYENGEVKETVITEVIKLNKKGENDGEKDNSN